MILIFIYKKKHVTANKILKKKTIGEDLPYYTLNIL